MKSRSTPALLETPLRPADLLFVFGTRKDVAERVEEACRLWREGYFRWAIVSGGITPGSELSECEIISAAMILLSSKLVDGFQVDGFFAAMIGSLLLAIVSAILGAIAGETKK